MLQYSFFLMKKKLNCNTLSPWCVYIMQNFQVNKKMEVRHNLYNTYFSIVHIYDKFS